MAKALQPTAALAGRERQLTKERRLDTSDGFGETLAASGCLEHRQLAESGRWPDRNGSATFGLSTDIPDHARLVGSRCASV